MLKNRKPKRVLALFMLMCLLLTGCGEKIGEGSETRPTAEAQALTGIPERLEKTDKGIPALKVWDADGEKLNEMDIETY